MNMQFELTPEHEGFVGLEMNLEKGSERSSLWLCHPHLCEAFS